MQRSGGHPVFIRHIWTISARGRDWCTETFTVNYMEIVVHVHAVDTKLSLALSLSKAWTRATIEVNLRAIVRLKSERGRQQGREGHPILMYTYVRTCAWALVIISLFIFSKYYIS